ncbi:hypothetical protein e2017b09.tmp0271 [Eimeria tenella]|uniref:Uncharacterized protein n=1 Tax=Eimeria tenella TaxID=5802 RepID=C8TDX6_EIMTE|nr:hypothetical protein e2017b09.tmp0271 [Eimeria tenella]
MRQAKVRRPKTSRKMILASQKTPKIFSRDLMGTSSFQVLYPGRVGPVKLSPRMDRSQLLSHKFGPVKLTLVMDCT